MPPTRGHDLKLKQYEVMKSALGMPPTRGHDLKHATTFNKPYLLYDAPHTGARLETRSASSSVGVGNGCPPHGGTT